MAIDIPAGTPLAAAVQAAQGLLADRKYREASAAYRQALQETGEGRAKADLRRALWEEHVGGLLAREALSEAESTARSYLETARRAGDPEGELTLLLLLGEAFAAQGDWPDCFQVLAEIRDLRSRSPEVMKKELPPSLLRLEGRAALERDDPAAAQGLLARALQSFQEAGDTRAARDVERDLQTLELELTGARAADSILASLPKTTSETLLAARALRRKGRYEAAANLLERRLERDVEPALRFPVLYEIILLRQLLGDQRTVAALLPLLKEAAETAGNPREARAAVERIAQRPGDGWAATGGTDFEGLLYDAQAFVRNGDLEAAEKALIELRGRASSPRFAAYWSIAAGELEWARAQGATGVQGAARQALGHFARASRLAGDSSEPHIRAEALRLAGRVQALIFADAKGAADRWIEAARLDEQVAHLQETDEIRIRYLESHPTELDEVIGTTAARVPVEGGQAAAQVLAALELARGVTFLSLVQPASAVRPRSVPASEDLQGCWAWCRDLGADLPRDMAMWILHPTPDRLYQAVLGNGILHWVATPVDRYELSNTLSELRTSWSGKDVLESLVQNHPDILPDRLGKLARWLRLDLSLGTLPAKVRRLAIVAGGSLADIPFAALPLPGSASPPQLLVSRYALSYLPCLSAQHPLGQRSARNRGDAGLLVRPPAADLTGSTGNGFHLLDQKAATPSGLGRVLQSGACPMVRIDCHGSYDAGDAQESWLALSTEDGDDGHLTARRLQSLPLRSCGTLILGACESGMSQERGRDERIGFARAGLAAGASAVLAARWVAEDQVASALLDAFQRRLRFLPRDEALRLSQLDLLQGRWRPSAGPSVPNPAHPARWACWSLWGDPGLQTSAGWIVRAFRRLFAGQEKS